MNRLSKTVISLNLSTLAVFLSKGPLAGADFLKNIYYQWAVRYSTPNLEKVQLSELVGTHEPITIAKFERMAGTVRTDELVSIAYIVSQLNPKTILEIGTCDGATTFNLALNAKQADIWTIDLPLQCTETVFDKSDDNLVRIRNVGKAFKGHAEEQRIHQIFSDSAVYDFTSLRVQFDFVFIDGSHTYDYVKNDTEKIMPLVTPGGVVVWHDCCQMGKNYGVYEYLSEMWKEDVTIIEGTTLAYYKKKDV